MTTNRILTTSMAKFLSRENKFLTEDWLESQPGIPGWLDGDIADIPKNAAYDRNMTFVKDVLELFPKIFMNGYKIMAFHEDYDQILEAHQLLSEELFTSPLIWTPIQNVCDLSFSLYIWDYKGYLSDIYKRYIKEFNTDTPEDCHNIFDKYDMSYDGTRAFISQGRLKDIIQCNKELRKYISVSKIRPAIIENELFYSFFYNVYSSSIETHRPASLYKVIKDVCSLNKDIEISQTLSTIVFPTEDSQDFVYIALTNIQEYMPATSYELRTLTGETTIYINYDDRNIYPFNVDLF